MRAAEEMLCIVGVMCVQHVTCSCDGYNSDRLWYWKQSCGLMEVPQDIPTQVRAVVLGENSISHIRDGAFRHLTVCTELFLHNNALTETRAGMWEGLSSLTTLSLGSNQISTIWVGAFNTLTSLEELDLHRNQLSMIGVGAFNTLSSLTKLYLYSNQISTIGVGAFNTLTSLTELWLSRNQISTIPVGAFNTLTFLQVLWLENNQLVTLEEGLFNTPLRTNLELDLRSNPLQCNERMCWIKEVERVRHITWYTWSGGDGRPQCKNQPGIHWDNITLNCEPGQS